jgi:hypothetical protein
MLTKRARERQAGGLGARARALDEWGGYWPPPAAGSSGPAGFSELLVMPVSELA